jgi:muconolactone delta-isomerase
MPWFPGLGHPRASMPLRIWRDDHVTPLVPHHSDPGPSTRPSRAGAEFLTTFMATELTPLTPHPDPATTST